MTGAKSSPAPVKKARRRTSDQVLDKLAAVDDHGRRAIGDDPPIAQDVGYVDLDDLQGLFEQYYRTTRPDTALLLSQFTLVDFILRVVGVRSVGTRCYVLLFVGPACEPLFLQAKEAPPSVLETYGREPLAIANRCSRLSQGERVVSGQRILQAQSDPFLGWVELCDGEGHAHGVLPAPVPGHEGIGRHQRIAASEFQDYGRLCAAAPARAHSQSPGGAVIRGYLGRSDQFDLAVAHWATRYADQAAQDFDTLQAAVQHGRLPVEYGV